MLVRALFLATLLAATAPAAFADPAAAVRRTWLERVAISAADQSCNLFSDGERLALLSGLYQAEGELLRANQAPAEMRRLATDVTTHAKSLGCVHPEVVSVAETVRNGYRAFVKTTYIEYPAAHAIWGASRSVHDRWAVSQTDKATSIVFGLRRAPAKPEEVRVAIAMPAEGLVPSAVQLFVRDPAKMPEPWFGAFSRPGAKLSPPPRAISHIEWAGKVASAKDAVGEMIWVFSFNPSVIPLLEQLDPREAVQVELIPPSRAKDQAVRRIVFEVGDIRAARAFAMIPQPQGGAPAQTAAATPAAH
jgi:hypothetical protein